MIIRIFAISAWFVHLFKPKAFSTLFCDIFILCNHTVVIMPRAGEGRSIRIDPEVYEALLTLKRGNMTFSDVIAQMLHECYGWTDEFSATQRELEDFIEIHSR